MAHGLWTLLMMLIFVGIIFWAWSSARKDSFERASRSVLENTDKPHRSDHDG